MKYFISILFILVFTATTLAQNKVVTDTITVSGVCDMCKKRIENAAYLPGVKKAEWTASTQKLVVIYNPKKITLLKIEESIAEVGHDTENVKAKDEVYGDIHGCCKYRESEVH
jgi:hypothetical protein